MGDLTGQRFYIIAGEPSGDRLGGALMSAFSGTDFDGVGGQDMTAAGLGSLFPMADLTVMGLSEVLPRLPLILRRIRETAEDVIEKRPDALITIDSPDFTLRVARKVKATLPDLKVIHYVAPSVWAWRPGRAAKMARHVDHVLCLLPFEPPYMHAAGMSAEFVGHPVAAIEQPTHHAITAWRSAMGIDGPALLLAPGSRRGEVRRLIQVFADTVDRLRATSVPDLKVICPLAETVAADVRAELKDRVPDAVFLAPDTGFSDKRLAFGAADAALCASGTITLEIAAAGTPMVAAYRTTWLTAQIVRRVVKVNTANLINLISGRNVVPEFLQEFCTVDAMSEALSSILNARAKADAQREAFAEVMAKMGRGGLPPEERAAASIKAFLNGQLMNDSTGYPALQPPGPKERHIGRS
jgi:lipid-A-disaccharide synthase